MVENARAAARDNPTTATEALKELAAIRLKDAEEGCHKLFRKYSLTVPVKIEKLNVGTGELQRCPGVVLSTWVNYLLDQDKLSFLTGFESESKMELYLQEYWARYRALHPRHEVFGMAERDELQLRRCIPVYSHIDEGRTYKSKALLILSVHGALGRGTRSYNKRMGVRKLRLKKDPMKMNFIGSTWGTQFIIFSLLRTASLANPAAFDALMLRFASDMAILAKDGVWNTAGSKRVWIQHIGLKGDLPALSKAGKLERCFSRMPRHVSARAKCPGICFLCLAGKEGDTEAESTPFEEMHAGAKWKATIMQEAPWTDLPHVMQGLPWVPGEEASFLKTDLWHNWHNGIGKIWLACSFVMLATLNVLQGGSVDSKFEELTGEFLSWAQRAGISPYLRQLNRDTFSFQTNNSNPQGSWSKAAATTQLMLFLSSFCDDRVEGRTADPLLNAIATCRESLFV